jgi:cell division protein FtsI/penicillin-binding protein 2
VNLYHSVNNFKKEGGSRKSDPRIYIITIFVFLFSFCIIAKLFVLMVLQNNFYSSLAAGSHEMFAKLFPKRGEVYIQDTRTGEKFPLAINRDYFLLYADTRLIDTEWDAREEANKLAEIFSYDDEEKEKLFNKLNKQDDPYEPIEKKLDEEQMDVVKDLNLTGLNFVRSPYRFYPENNLAAQVIGFLGKDSGGNNVGRYGIEGYWDKTLAGSGGFYEGLKTAAGSRITFGDALFEPAQDGADITLTIDRTIQFRACEILREAQEEYKAQSASLVVMNPVNGAILAMCSLPDFNSNDYGSVESVNTYNNSTIFTPYEPGSIFKPIVMSSAINEEVLTPHTTFFDTGVKEGLCDTPIKNANGKDYELQDMIGVLENSINTGMIFVVERLGKKNLQEYLGKFGFGVKSGIGLDTESSGTLESLYKNKSDKIDCYSATASFGQGVAVTPLQMVSAFSVIANGGMLFKPFIVEEIDYPDGKIDNNHTKEVRRVLSKKTTSLVTGMLVNVVDIGQAKGAQVPGYYVAGKTGTAQIPGIGGYTEDTIHSFVGYAPVDEPKFVMIVKFEKPERSYSSVTAAPTFSKIAKFILEYYGIPPER